jgi:hypothetical protein
VDQKQVFRLEIAMDDVRPVHLVERQRRLTRLSRLSSHLNVQLLRGFGTGTMVL